MENSLMKLDFSDEHVKLIKDQIAKGSSDAELQLFIYQCKRTGLDPLTRQIYCLFRNVKNKDSGQYEKKMTIQTSIDGFRVIAERSGDYGGQDEPIFIEDESRNLIGAKVKVYRFRGEQRYPAAVGVAYWSEYVPQPGQDAMWRKMPRTMISKVAEALALRKAYPQDLSGIYTIDEMSQDNKNDIQDISAMPVTDNSDLQILIDSCETIPELAALYNNNSALFESDTNLKTYLTNRKNTLRNAATTVQQ
ncbi:phage recombination protein Bet [Chitinophaga nivalis]|uniref:Phage recombination protein Bet n=1 Tax=Chitinophaga nivalis TaxID=2991709 RepID=A0ABT3IIM0_9BACT|nr:phage recombination protein Bet [Chitinophaga nivalis]MCW3466526.1 phage recombination protein Bet [Chitinophaga nivalis]MCW3483783.1 phage recombination protein Bet [Chitinophaga nivalis]